MRYWADESGRRRAYNFVVVWCTDQEATARDLRGLLRPGQTHLHMTGESPRRRRLILSVLVAHEVHGLAVRCRSQPPVLARQATLAVLAQYIFAEKGAELILERQAGEEPRDRRTLAEATRRATDRGQVYRHADKRAEPMLWAADAFAWSFGSGGEWRRRIARILVESREV